jgi:GntR family transcriptional repressor for pyruvate dehydrogenase complex
MTAGLEAVRAPASHELVVDQIRRAIRIGRYIAGDKLPPERELARQLGVSRTTVREALRVLQGEGMVATRRGRSGGPVVLDAMTQGTGTRSRLAEIDRVYEFRGVVESATARLAAERRSKREVAHLRQVVEVMSSIAGTARNADGNTELLSRFFASDTDLHISIAKAARNPMLLTAVENARTAMFLPVGAIFTRLHPTANDFHSDIVAGIEGQDPDAAAAAMLAHVENTRSALRAFAKATPRAKRIPAR